MIKYYRERSGPRDYVSVDTGTAGYYRELRRAGCAIGADYEGRATAIAGLVTSVCTTGLSQAWLSSHCCRVPAADVPPEWLAVLGPGTDIYTEEDSPF